MGRAIPCAVSSHQLHKGKERVVLASPPLTIEIGRSRPEVDPFNYWLHPTMERCLERGKRMFPLPREDCREKSPLRPVPTRD